MGIAASIIAAIVGAAEGIADAAAAVGAAAGSAAEAALSSIELTSLVGEAASDTIPLLEGEEETIFDASTLGDEAYADEGAVNDPWNWEAAGESASRVPRYLGAGLAAGAGISAAAAGIAFAVGKAAASHTEAGATLLEASEIIDFTLEEQGAPPSDQTVPDILLGFMTPAEYEYALEELQRRQMDGSFNPSSLQEAENAVVYIPPTEGIPYASKDQSLLLDVAQSDQSPPWFLPGASGQPLTRGMVRRAAQAARVAAEGAERSQVFRISADLRRELERTGRALDRVYDRVRQNEIARRVAEEIADQALEIGLNQGQQIIGNVLGGGAIAASIAAALTGGAAVALDRFFGPKLPSGSVEIENSHYEEAPALVRAQGGLWRKGRADYLVEENGTLGTVTLSYYAPEQTNRGLPSTEPWFHFAPRTKDQLLNLEEYLKNNWGGNFTQYQPSSQGMFIVGDLVLQEAQYRRKKNASSKRRNRGSRPGGRTKRTRRARN